MANEFRRTLPEGALDYLQSMPGWWRDVVEYRHVDEAGRQRRLLIALRNGYFNVYAEGQSVLKVGFDARRSGGARVRCKLHKKYALGSDAGAGYLDFDGSKLTQPGSEEPMQEYAGPETLGRWISAARTYAGDEKKGVAVIADRHPNVIDVEMALPANDRATPNEKKVANRMDIVALESSNSGARLAFYEAKLFSNPELRARDLVPRVLKTQLKNYCEYVSAPERRNQIINAYREACRYLVALNQMRQIETHLLVEDVAKGLPLELDPQPRLIVFGYSDHQVEDGSPWKQHEQVLRSAAPLIMERTAEAIRLQA